MTITLTDSLTVLDETAGLQNSTATGSAPQDANDTEILVASLPSIFSTLGAGTAIGAALSGYTGAAGNTGSNAFTLSSSVSDIGFVGPNGAPLNGLDSGLDTLDGTSILLYTSTTNNNVLLGRAGVDGPIVFAAYIEETATGGKIWTAQYQPLAHPITTNPDDALTLLDKVFIGTSQDLTFSLANAPSGQNLFLMFTTATPNVVGGRITDPTIIATGKNPADQSSGVNITTGDTINTSQAGGPTTFGTNNQMITEEEGIRFTFVTGARQDLTIPNLDQNEADIESNIDFTNVFNARSASFDVVQLQSGKSAVVKISAFTTAVETGINFVNGYGNDTKVGISNIVVKNSSTGQVVNDPGLLITITDGIATISGVKAGYRIEYTTTADHNRVLVENGAALNAKGNNHADFDIGGFTLGQVSTDKVEIGSTLVFEDDGPSATGAAASGTVDEDGLTAGIPGGTGDVAGEATVASGSVTGIFQSGADAPLTYSLSSITSGLPQTLTSGGVAVTYSVLGNTLTASAGSVSVFTFSLTTAGAYTFTLLKPLDHPAGNDENDITLNLGSLLRATDADGDTVTAAPEKLVITVDDDTPTATGTAASGTVDEDGLTAGIPGGTGDVAGEATVASGSVAGIFQSGADTPLSYTLSSDTSGLPALSSGGTALVYSVLGNTLTAKAGGVDVFTFSLSATGDYSFTLLKPLDHAAGNDENDITLNLGSLLQATDADGDTVTAAPEKLVITVDDDTPTATGTAATGTVDEDGLTGGIPGGTGDVVGQDTVASGSVTGIFQSGADTPLTYSLSSITSGLPQTLTSGGVAVTYSVLGNTLTASAGGVDVFTFSLTTAGDYSFTLLKPLDHAAGNDENDITLNLGSLLQATDADGDTVTSAPEKLVITVDDDTPTATGTAATGTVDEDGLTAGIPGGTGDVIGQDTVASGSVTGIFQSGADTPLSYALSSDTSGLPALSSGGTALVYSVAGNTLTAKAGGVDVFTFSLTTAGDYSFTLLKPLDHAAGGDENDITLNLGSLLQATDADGDTVTAAPEKLVITVDDDTPTATGTAASGTVDEDGLANGIPGGTGDVAGAATSASGSVTGIFQSGADTPLSYALSSDTSGLPALSSGGTALVYSVAGNTLTAKAGGVDVFTFSLTTAGDYSFTLLKPLDHAAGGDENDLTLNLGSLLQATDADGDTVTAAPEKLVITVDDDTPTATGAASTGTVDEDGLANGIAGGTGDVAGAATSASGSVTGIFQSGADTPLSYALSSNTSGLQALSSGGTALVYSVAGNTLTAKAGGVDVFTFSLTAAGAYTFTLLKPLDHATGNDENDLTLNLGSLLQATDKDGDTVTAAPEQLVITVDDDTPTLAFGNLIGTGTVLPQRGYWNMAAGADGVGATGLDISLVNGQFTLVRPDNTTTTGTGTLNELSPSPDANGAYHFGGTLTGDFDNNASTANTSIDYTLTAFANGTYELDLVQGFSSTIVLSSANGSLGAGGPDPVRTLLIPTQNPPTIPSPSEEIVFFGVNAGTTAAQVLSAIVQGAPDLTEAQIESGGFSFLGTANMNVSTAGIGIANNNLDGNGTAGINAGDESFVINPESLLTGVKVFIDNSVGGYTPATEELYYRIFFEDGSSSAQTKVLAADLATEAGSQKSFLVQWDGTKMIDAVQLTMGLGVVKIPVIQFIKQTESMANDVQLAFSATLTDKDGDTATSTFDANLFANDPNDPLFDFRLAGTSGERDAFNVDLSGTHNQFQVTGFDAGPSLRDALVLNGDQNAVVQSIDNTGADSIVTIDESGVQTTTITVVGVDLLNTDIVIGSA
ncbi:hypothetical protein [Pseudomonas sp. LFM046]|uniref:beta strand repeat-containing protein n=1 Tax=Pseudomonas sp. LFM046 TaxID=1608357 RepID=UPI001F5BAB41|nr:hypothetical protein [Pseudomonas sp. LFM046]